MYITYKMYSTYKMYFLYIYIYTITSSTFPTFFQDLQRAGSCGRCKACSTGGTCATCKGTPRLCTSCSALGFERTIYLYLECFFLSSYISMMRDFLKTIGFIASISKMIDVGEAQSSVCLLLCFANGPTCLNRVGPQSCVCMSFVVL